MTSRSLFAGTLVVSVVSISSIGCSGSAGDATSVTTRPVPSTSPANRSRQTDPTRRESGQSATTVGEPQGASTFDLWPADLDLPDGMEVVGTPGQVGNETSVTVSCNGPGSTALTALTATLDGAGYHTTWKLGSPDDVDEPVAVEATAKDRALRATIYSDDRGACTKVVITSMR